MKIIHLAGDDEDKRWFAELVHDSAARDAEALSMVADLLGDRAQLSAATPARFLQDYGLRVGDVGAVTHVTCWAGGEKDHVLVEIGWDHAPGENNPALGVPVEYLKRASS